MVKSRWDLSVRIEARKVVSDYLCGHGEKFTMMAISALGLVALRNGLVSIHSCKPVGSRSFR